MKKQAAFLTIALISAIVLCGAVSATEAYDIGTDVTNNANSIGITNSTSPDDALVITTAGSAEFKGETTEDSLQGIVDTTSAITPGNGNLITLNQPNGALEFTFIKKSGTTLIAKKYTAVSSGTGYSIDISDPVFISAADITNLESVKQELGSNWFAIVSIANAWANGAPDDLLRIAGYSGGVSEGLISSYAMAQSFVGNYPLTQSDQSYHVLVSPGGGDDNVPMFLMDDTPLKWSTAGSIKYYDFYGMSNGNPNDNVYIWWDSGDIAGKLSFWTLNPQNKIDFGTVISGTLSEIQFNNWLLGKLGTDAGSLVRIEKLATITKADFDYLWANGIDRTYIMNLGGTTPSWTTNDNVVPVNNYAAMSTAAQNAVTTANAAFAAQGLAPLNGDDLVITSAGYSQVNGLSFGALDGIISATGIKLENLYSLKRGSQTPLWFVFVKKPTTADGPLYAVFVDDSGNIVNVNYAGTPYSVFDISGTNLAGDPGSEGYAKSEAVKNAYTYSIPSYAQQDYYIVSLANQWAIGMPYDILRPACDGGCPGSGLSMGYVITQYIKSILPLGPNEYYVYIGIPAHCKEQAIMEGLGISPAQGTYFTPGLQSSSSDPNSAGIAIRWNSITNTGTAVLINYNSTIISGIQPSFNSKYWYKTMYWALWYLEEGFPGMEDYGTVLSAYSIGTKSDGTTPALITITKQDFNELVAAGEDPVAYIKNFVAPVTPPTPTPQPGGQGTGITSGITDGIAQTSALLTQAVNGAAQETTTPSEVAPGLPLGDTSSQTSGTSDFPVIPAAGILLLVIILILVYLGRETVVSAIKGSERLGK